MRRLRADSLGDSGITNYYHVISRVVNRDLVFGPGEKEHFRALLVKQLRFSGLKAVSWCFMGNHFHLLLEVPDKKSSLEGWTQEKLLKQLKVLADEEYTWKLLRDIEMWKTNGNTEGIAKAAESVRRRMFDLSSFMKELKQKFAAWFNKRHERKGTLWEERFKCVLLEGPDVAALENHAVKVVAAYIDLNPVRAGIVEDPADYRWCSYAAAVAGDKDSRKGLSKALGMGARATWRSVVANYRQFLFMCGEERAAGATASGYHKARLGFSREEVEKVLKEGGKLPLQVALRCQVRYISEGLVLGGSHFVENFYQKREETFGPTRQSGARTLKGADWGGLRAIREPSQGVKISECFGA